MSRIHLGLICVVGLFALGLTPAAAQTRFVATTGADSGTCVNVGSPCRTIQYAHGQAINGDTINIAAGTYSEAPRITKSVTLNGAGAPSTIIAPQLVNQLPGPPPTPANSSVIIDITGAVTVTIQNLTVRFPSGQYPASGVSPINGIWATGGANLTVRSSTVTEIHDADVSGVQAGNCIRAGSTDRGPAGTVMIENNTISRCQKTGIIADRAGTVATIQGNTVVDGGLGERNSGGPRTQTVIAPNGVQVSSGASAAVNNNTVRRMQCELPTPQCGGNIDNDVATASGILLFNVGAGTVVTNNTVETSDDAVAALNPAGAIPIPLTANTLRNNRWRNVVGYSGTVILSGNTLDGAQHGVLAVGFGEARQAIVDLNPANTAANANIIRNASINAIWIRNLGPTPERNQQWPLSLDAESASALAAAHLAAQAPTGLSPGPLVRGSSNQFITSGVAGLDNQPDEGTGNLACNWWGAATGPGTAGANPALISPGDTVSPFAINNVNYACPLGPPTLAVGITKTGPATAAPGAQITWIVTITNNGPADGAGSVFTDPVPAVITNVTWTCAASNGALCANPAGSGNNINQPLPVFPPGGQLIYTIVGTLPATPGQYINVATVTPSAIPGAVAVSATAVIAAAAAAVAIDTLSSFGWLLLLLGLAIIGVLALRQRAA